MNIWDETQGFIKIFLLQFDFSKSVVYLLKKENTQSMLVKTKWLHNSAIII